MKQKILLFLAFILTGAGFNVALAQTSPNVTVVENIETYDGTDPYVFNQADGKVYVRNNVNEYERYGLYEQVSTLKIAGGGDTEIEYIETIPGMGAIPYINTGYIHKANTHIVAEVNITDNTAGNYEAIFGSRAGYGSQMFVFFWRFEGNNRGCYARNVEVRGGEDIPAGEKVIVDANGLELNVYYPDDLEWPAAYIADDGEPVGGSTPMYIFDLCHGDHADNSRAYFKLYTFKIYEGEELVMDLKPFVSSAGEAGLVDKVSGKRFFSANGAKFAVSPDGQAAIDASGVTVYEGKLVYNTTDQKLYKYTNGQFQSIGGRTLVPIEGTDYKNMNNWQTNDGHKSVYWPAEGESIIDYEEAEDANYIEGYSGIAGYEPLMTQIATVPDEDYNFSFEYAGCAYESWHNVPMHVFVTNRYDLGTNEAGLGVGGDVLGTFECPFEGIDPKVPVSIDFTAEKDLTTIVAQFGDCADGASSWFEFHKLLVQKYEYPEKYPALNPFAPQIELLLVEVENFDSDVPNPIKQALTDAAAAAKATLGSEDLAEQKTALENLQKALQNAKDNDLTMLRKVIAAAKADGVDVTDYEAFCEEGTAGTADQVDRLRAERKISHIEKDAKSDWPGHDIAPGKFYLYNVGTGAYFTSGSDWGTHAAIGYPGLELTLIETEGGYNVQFEELIPQDARDRFLGGSPYVDCADGAKDVYTFLPVDGKPGVYNVKGSRGYLAFDPDGHTDTGRKYFNTVTATWEEPVNEMAEWILVTKEERLALMDNATEDNPVDATLLIADPSFNKFAQLDAEGNELWIGRNQGWGWGDAWFGDKNTETWNSQEYTIGQSVQLPKGTYELKVQTYYRDGNFESHVESVANGEELMPAPMLFADMNETPIVYIHSEADKAPGEGADSEIGNIPNSMYQASLFFENGLYWNTLKFYNEADGEVFIGIYKEEGNRPENWIVADNFRLTYFGEEDTTGISETKNDARTAAKDVKVFDLSGRRISAPAAKGVYIMGNKKVAVK